MGHTIETLKAQAAEAARSDVPNFDGCILVAFHRNFANKLGLAFEEDEVCLAKPNLEVCDDHQFWIVFSMRQGLFTHVPAHYAERFEEKTYAFLFHPEGFETPIPTYLLLRNGIGTGIVVEDRGGTFLIGEQTEEDTIGYHLDSYPSREEAFAAAEALHTRRIN